MGIPKKIYLQVGEDVDPEDIEGSWDHFEGITWCTDNIHGNDIEYIHSAELERLRELLWLRHGCEITSLYGDDGEMQCSKCLIDFKRNSIEDISKALGEGGE